MGQVVLDFEETFTERRTRRVRVVDGECGDVTAWHGGRKLAEIGAWTSLERALRDAREAADRFGVDPGSSLSIRVGRTVTRSWEYPDSRDAGGPCPRVIHRRHVHDVARGDLPVARAALAYRLAAWVGVPDGEDPAPYVPFFQAPDVTGFSDRALFAGYGHGEPEWTPATVRPHDAAPPEFQRGDGGITWHRVAIDGRLPVFVPEGGSAATLVEGGLCLDIATSFGSIPGEVRDRGRFRGCHAPEDRTVAVAG